MPDSRNQPICPGCQRSMTLEVRPGGKSPRTFQDLDCDRPDPIQSDPLRWLSGELGRPELAASVAATFIRPLPSHSLHDAG
jgi:hypothetical protein